VQCQVKIHVPSLPLPATPSASYRGCHQTLRQALVNIGHRCARLGLRSSSRALPLVVRACGSSPVHGGIALYGATLGLGRSAQRLSRHKPLRFTLSRGGSTRLGSLRIYSRPIGALSLPSPFPVRTGDVPACTGEFHEHALYPRRRSLHGRPQARQVLDRAQAVIAQRLSGRRALP